MFWLINLFPNLLIHIIFAAGILLFLAASFLGMIPLVRQYQLPGQILGFLLAGLGLFYEGGLAYKEGMQKEVAKLEARLAKAETEAAKANLELQTKATADTQIIREKGKTIIRYLETTGRKYDDQCVIPSDIIAAHNRAATLDSSPAPSPTNSSPQSSSDTIVLPPRTSK